MLKTQPGFRGATILAARRRIYNAKFWTFGQHSCHAAQPSDL